MSSFWKILVVLSLIIALIGGYFGWKAYGGARKTSEYLRAYNNPCPPPTSEQMLFYCWVEHTNTSIHDLSVMARAHGWTPPPTDSHGPPPLPPGW